MSNNLGWVLRDTVGVLAVWGAIFIFFLIGAWFGYLVATWWAC